MVRVMGAVATQGAMAQHDARHDGRGLKYACAGVAISAIWTAVLLTGLFAPDMVTGSEHDHTPVAALFNWFWASLATGFILLAVALRRRDGGTHRQWWYALAIGSVALWAGVTVVSVAMPVQKTGSDPTEVPTAALVAPVVAMVATSFLAGFVAIFSSES